MGNIGSRDRMPYLKGCTVEILYAGLMEVHGGSFDAFHVGNERCIILNAYNLVRSNLFFGFVRVVRGSVVFTVTNFWLPQCYVINVLQDFLRKEGVRRKYSCRVNFLSSS